MASRRPEQEIGLRGPFDAYETRESMLASVDRFIRRTGLHDYAHYFRIGAFLARRPFGKRQVEYLKRAHREEDEKSRERASGSQEESHAAPEDARGASNDADESRALRRRYEYQKLDREGDRGRWRIFQRQKWRVHALVLCCSLGAMIQGMDESAVNGGNPDLPQLRSSLKSTPAQLYYQNTFKIANHDVLIGLINSAPYLMCIVSCL